MDTPGPRCTECVWIHEADSTAGTSFQGVGLCALHASARELYDTVVWLIQERENGTDKGLLPDGLLNKARCAIARATGEEA